MPTFALTTHAPAPVEEVWKLLHDPARFPEWWDGFETVAPRADGDYTIWPTGYPDFPMAQRLRSEPGDTRVTISCLVSDLVFRWQLREDGEATDIDVEVEIPDPEAHRLPDQRRVLQRSLANLADLAAHAARTG
jgi:Polyketide cyclase / dehydrase and lipid transport